MGVGGIAMASEGGKRRWRARVRDGEGAEDAITVEGADGLEEQKIRLTGITGLLGQRLLTLGLADRGDAWGQR